MVVVVVEEEGGPSPPSSSSSMSSLSSYSSAKKHGDLPILGYWNIRGNAQPIRLLLAYTMTPYVDKRYNFGKVCDRRHPEWMADKFELGLDFPNLPYYIDGTFRLTQSLAILRHLAREHNLAGQKEKERIRIDLVEQQLRQLRNRFIDATLADNFETAQLNYFQELPASLAELSGFLGENPYFAGKAISYVDFMAYEYIDQHHYLMPALVRRHANLLDFTKRLESLPTIHEYQMSEQYVRWPSGLVIPWYENQFFSTFNRSLADQFVDTFEIGDKKGSSSSSLSSLDKGVDAAGVESLKIGHN